ncbi:MAG: VWA domain-containing protein [Terracidiphilus sp.]
MKPGLAVLALASIFILGSKPVFGQQQPSSVPDAPAPQPAPSLAGADGVTGPITPGSGSGETEAAGSSSSSDNQTQPPPGSQPPSAQPKDQFQTAPPDQPTAAQMGAIIRTYTNLVIVPVTVKDSKGKEVPGLTWRDFRVFENGQRQELRIFSADAAALSVAFVIDQSLTSDVMAKVNDSLASVQGALTPYDEIDVFSYSHGAQERGGFTGAQSARVPAVFALAKETGTEELLPINSGPLAGCSITQNGSCIDPNIQPGRSTGNSTFITIPKEIHTLNDAILAAAKELSTRPKERRRIIYVVSDGKEAGSKATYKEVVHYLQMNNITVYGTLVGDSARWGEGYLSRFHLPFQMYDNRLVGYATLTGGTLDAENGVNGIENSYAKIAEEARTQYTLGYYTHEPFIDGKYRSVEVRVERSGLDVIAKRGYYPSALDAR